MPANITFLLVEGPHDAEFMARLLKLRGFEQRKTVSAIPDLYRKLIPKDYPVVSRTPRNRNCPHQLRQKVLRQDHLQ